MVNHKALAEELRDARYTGLDDKQRLDDMKASTREIHVNVPASKLAGAVELGGFYEELVTAAANGHRGAGSLLRITRGETLVETLTYADPTKRAAIDTLLDSLASAGLTPDQIAGLRSLGIEHPTVHELMGSPSERDIMLAREAG